MEGVNDLTLKRFDKALGEFAQNLNKLDTVMSKMDARIQELEAKQLEILADYYRHAPLACAVLCDDILDPSGKLLGKVRHGAMEAARKEGDLV